jgi:hypothetical protein
MTTLPGQESQSAKKGDGDITASRTIQTPSALVQITGTLTEVDRIYRLTHKSLLQNGYSLTHLTKTDTVPLGEPDPVIDEIAELKKTIDRLVDESMDLIKKNKHFVSELLKREAEIRQLQRMQTALEDTISRVTS